MHVPVLDKDTYIYKYNTTKTLVYTDVTTKTYIYIHMQKGFYDQNRTLLGHMTTRTYIYTYMYSKKTHIYTYTMRQGH